MEGYDVASAASGREALERISRDHPDLILLDLLIPPPDGLEVIRAVKKDRVTSTIPLVVMTVKRDVQSKVECLRSGADDFIVKPFHFDELDAVLRASLKKRYLYASLERVNRQLREANEKLLKLSVTDNRTNLLNDRYLKRRLAEEFKRAQRYGASLSAMMLDLDHFKQINDKYGHDGGDRVLTEVASRLRSNIRPNDAAARLGGDEFVCVLKYLSADEHTAAAQSDAVIARLTSAIREPIDLAGAEVSVGASFGLALTADPTESTAELLRRADAAMYSAKQIRQPDR